MRRPLSVRQRENSAGDEFWYVVKGRNGKVLTTSEMYATRRNAIRAARGFIADIDPVQVEFSYVVGRDRKRDTVQEVVR